MQEKDLARECLTFIDKSPSCFHAVQNLEEMLQKSGFEKLSEKEEWKLEKGGSYYAVRGGSSLIAFRLPEKDPSGFHMMAAHSDSPGFKIKPGEEMITGERYVRLNTERYGGMILSAWLDRPLSVAGRIVLEQDGMPQNDIPQNEVPQNGGQHKILQEKLINIDRDLLVIPNLAVHMNRDMNKGVEYNPQTDMLPLFGSAESGSGSGAEGSFWNLVAKEAGTEPEKILGADLFLYVRQRGCFAGASEEFIVAPRLDDLQCAFVTIKALCGQRPRDYITVGAVFDNEEVGSQTRQGAASTFLRDVLENIAESLGRTGSVYKRMLADSFLISADNAHAKHPNRPEKADPVNAPCLNGGVVLKYHGGQKYMTDGCSEAFFKQLCREAAVPYQLYTNRSDIAGGSTLGNIAVSQVSVPGVDVGLPQLAMHSAVETAGREDIMCLYRAAEQYFRR